MMAAGPATRPTWGRARPIVVVDVGVGFDGEYMGFLSVGRVDVRGHFRPRRSAMTDQSVAGKEFFAARRRVANTCGGAIDIPASMSTRSSAFMAGSMNAIT